MPDRLGWLSTRVSATTIARTIGVSTARVRFALAGVQALPKAVENNLLNFYRRETYSYLRSVGLPKAEANRFKKGLPDTVEGIASEMDKWVMDMAKGDKEKAEEIRESTRKSKKTEEEIVGS